MPGWMSDLGQPSNVCESSAPRRRARCRCDRSGRAHRSDLVSQPPTADARGHPVPALVAGPIARRNDHLVRLPSSAALATLGVPRKCGRFSTISAPRSRRRFVHRRRTRARPRSRRTSGAPWEVRAARNATRQENLPASRRSPYPPSRPWNFTGRGCASALVGPDRSTAPSALADVTLVPIAPNVRAVAR